MSTKVLNMEEFPEILEMVRETGGKYILVEFGKPEFVVMAIDEYKNLIAKKEQDKKNNSGKKLIDKINQDIADWKMKNDEEEEDYLKYIPERFRPKKSDNEEICDEEDNDEEDDFIEEDLAYHYDVDEDDEDNKYNERYGENAPF